MTFAQEIFNIPLEDRFEWLENKTIQYLADRDAPVEEFKDLLSQIDVLKG